MCGKQQRAFLLKCLASVNNTLKSKMRETWGRFYDAVTYALSIVRMSSPLPDSEQMGPTPFFRQHRKEANKAPYPATKYFTFFYLLMSQNLVFPLPSQVALCHCWDFLFVFSFFF